MDYVLHPMEPLAVRLTLGAGRKRKPSAGSRVFMLNNCGDGKGLDAKFERILRDAAF
jgi:hypothetical protein